MQAKVDVTELMGSEIWLYMETADSKQFVARVDPRSQVINGEQIEMAVDMANTHIFDPKTEVNLANQ